MPARSHTKRRSAAIKSQCENNGAKKKLIRTRTRSKTVPQDSVIDDVVVGQRKNDDSAATFSLSCGGIPAQQNGSPLDPILSASKASASFIKPDKKLFIGDSEPHLDTPSMVPEEKTPSPARKPSSGNDRLQWLADAFREFSITHMPEARMVFAPHIPNSSSETEKQHISTTAATLERRVQGQRMIGVMQRPVDVDFHFRWNDIQCRIFYISSSDSCLLSNFGRRVFVHQLDGSKTSYRLEIKGYLVLEPGIWRITAILPNSHAPEIMMEFIIHQRGFKFYNLHLRATPAKRARFEELNSSPAPKRPKVDHADLEQHQPPAANAAANPQAITDGISTQPLPSNEDNLFACLQTGQPVRIADLPGETEALGLPVSASPWPTNYTIYNVLPLAMSKNTRVCVCTHTSIPNERIVAKVLQPSSKDNVVRTARLWMREKAILESLRHISPVHRFPMPEMYYQLTIKQDHIIAIRGFDARLLAIYLELLPKSLFLTQLSLLTAPETRTILRDMLSALAYLASKGVAHNDIKPLNIAYSPERGAVLLDFGLASRDPNWQPGGIPGYLCPEYFDRGVGGHPGDVWALGITMLCVLCKIPMPEHMRREWNMDNLADRGSSEFGAMVTWFQRVRNARRGLLKSDIVEAIVADMLQVNPLKRITAQAAYQRLQRFLLNEAADRGKDS